MAVLLLAACGIPAVAGASSRLMQSLGRRYVQYSNRYYTRSGSLWDGRYKSSVVQAEDYLLACMRYIELTPSASMVKDPVHYRWTSYRANGLNQNDPRVTPHPRYLGLDRDPTARCAAYRELFRPELDDAAANDIREALRLGMPLGNEWFAESICKALGIRRNSGRRGRSAGDRNQPPEPKAQQVGFGF